MSANPFPRGNSPNIFRAKAYIAKANTLIETTPKVLIFTKQNRVKTLKAKAYNQSKLPL